MKFTPMPLSVANSKTFQEWQSKLEALIEASGKERIMASIATLCAEDAAFAALVDKAVTNGGSFTEADLAEWAKTNVVKATALHQQMSKLPNNLSALKIGIDCIKATADTSKYTEAELAQFNDASYWDNITMDDVQKYCTTLLDMR